MKGEEGMKAHIATVAVTAIVCGTILVVACFIWPTPYTYERATRPRYDDTIQEVYRVNRFTGRSELVIGYKYADGEDYRVGDPTFAQRRPQGGPRLSR